MAEADGGEAETGRPVAAVLDEWWKEADVKAVVGYVLTILPIVMGIVKVFAFSRWNVDNVRVVVRALDLPAVGLIVLYPFALVLFPVAVDVLIHQLGRRGARRRVVWAVAAVAVAILVVVGPLLYSAIAIVVVALSALTASRRSRRRAVFRMPVVWFFGVAVLFGVAAFSSSGTWLPREVVVMVDGTHREGFVLEAGDHHLTLMDDHKGVPEILEQDDVQKRVLCVAPAGDHLSIGSDETTFQWLTNSEPAQLPPCGEVN